MHNADMGGKTLAEKARFLEGLGLDRKDVAEMLGTTYASITELMRQAKNKKKGTKKSAARKTKGR
jgi:plasmid maintenance system antidote protein VapI